MGLWSLALFTLLDLLIFEDDYSRIFWKILMFFFFHELMQYVSSYSVCKNKFCRTLYKFPFSWTNAMCLLLVHGNFFWTTVITNNTFECFYTFMNWWNVIFHGLLSWKTLGTDLTLQCFLSFMNWSNMFFHFLFWEHV